MKLTTFLLFLATLQITAGVYSQNAQLNLPFKSGTLADIISAIENQSDYKIFYKTDQVDVHKLVNITENDGTIASVLNNVLDGSDITYHVLDKLIVLTSSKAETQQTTITGKVTDSEGQPMPGVNIIIEGTTTGVTTDVNGNYKIEVPSSDAVLVFSFVGYTTEKVQLQGRKEITITMQPEVKNLDEIVVVGYGTQKKATATGSVVSSQGEDIKRSPATNLTNNLVGRLPGLTSVTRSGEPGQDVSTLRIRGTNTLGDNSPLVVVDGIPNRSMERIDPSDIESISILKDASAAIYGTQAANGVILVTTKRGKIGKPTISATINGGYNQPTRIPKMASAAQYAQMLNEIKYYSNSTGGRNQQYSDAEIQKFQDGSDPWNYPNTDWFKEVFQKWAGQNYGNVSINGGTENMKYFLSLGGRYEDGIYKNSATNFSQYDFRSNIDGKVSKNIDISFDVAGRQENKNYPTVTAGNIFRMLMRGKPNMPAFWPDGHPGPDIEYGFNPAIITTSATGYDKDKWYYLESNLRGNIKIPWVKGLNIVGNASFDKSYRYHKKWETPWYLYTRASNDPNDHTLNKGQRGLSAPRLTQDAENKYSITWNAYANYEHTFAEIHNIKLMVGTERQNGQDDNLNAYRQNYISSTVDQLFAGANDQYMTNTGSASQFARLSYFGRVNYDYRSKYLLEFVWRYDGSDKFPKSKQFGFFPGISAGWRLSDENFWKSNISIFDYFKIRASWGQTGNDRIAPYQYLATYGYSNDKSYVFSGGEDKLLWAGVAPNPEVTWEVANQSNIGFESTLLKKITLNFEYFYNLRTNILWKRDASVPASTGLTLPRENIGKVVNRGIEYMVGYRNQLGDFKYDISVNGSYAKNKVKFWDEAPGRPDYQLSTGKPMPSDINNPDNELYFQAIGIFRDQAAIDAYPHIAGARPGDIIFEDKNGDNIIDDLDRVRSEKNNIPRFTGGLTVGLQYKNVDAALLFQGAAGAQVYINTESGDMGNYLKEFADNRWTPENIDASWPRAFNRSNEYWMSRRNTFWLRKTDYIRLKNIEIGYTLPAKFNKLIGIEKLRIYANGINLFTVDKCKVYDPELDSGSGQIYPLQRVVNLGLTLTF